MYDLLLHIDLEFICGIVRITDNTYTILNSEDKYYWLYFYNDQINQEITYSKSYKKQFLNDTPNYFGNFSECIVKQDNYFVKNSTSYQIIELLYHSNLLKNIIDAYKKITNASDEESSSQKIPLNISFSDNISPRAKEIIIKFLSETYFKIISYKYSLSEIMLSYLYYNKMFAALDNVIVVEALNDNLNLSLLKKDENEVVRKNYHTYPEIGSDPRIRAIVKYVINQINSITGLLKTNEEKELEYKKQLQNGEEWVRRLNFTNYNIPLNINDVKFLITKDKNYSCIIHPAKIDECTGDYIRNLFDIFKHFLSINNLTTNVLDAVIFFGDSLNNKLIEEFFGKNIEKEKIIFLESNKLFDILKYYFKLNTLEAGDYESSLKEDAAKEKRVLENELIEKQKKEIADKEALVKKEREEREQRNKAEFETLVKEGKNYFNENKFKQALEKFEGARKLNIDNEFINKKLKEINKRIIEQEVITNKYQENIEKADNLFKEKNFNKSFVLYQLATELLPNEIYPKNKIEEINKILEYDSLIKEADKYLKETDYLNAEKVYDKAIYIFPNEQYAHEKKNEIFNMKFISKSEKVSKKSNLLSNNSFLNNGKKNLKEDQKFNDRLNKKWDSDFLNSGSDKNQVKDEKRKTVKNNNKVDEDFLKESKNIKTNNCSKDKDDFLKRK